ncbi:MAG: HAD family hydrolase [Bacteroidota bacterium]
MNKKVTILIDGDDTLWKTQELYNDAKSKFAYLLREKGFFNSDEEIIKRLDEIDSSRVPLRGLTKQRFIESMLILYGLLCGEGEIGYRIDVEKEIIGISKTLKRPPELFDDVPKALGKLKRYFRLVLFTSGHTNTQKRKIFSLKPNIVTWFDEIRFISIKNEKRLIKELTSMQLEPSEVWCVGNSLRSDVLPAINVGAKAVLVERGSWLYDINIPDAGYSEYLDFQKAEDLLQAAEIILEEECEIEEKNLSSSNIYHD